MALTKNSSTELQRRVAQKTILTATIIAIVLLLAGAFIMRLLHFTPGALSIAGGLILLILALSIVLNPVGIVSLTVFSAEAQGVLQLGLLILLVLVVAAIVLGVFLISHRLDKYLTNERIMVLERLLGIFLAALAVQLMINGLADLHIITVSVH